MAKIKRRARTKKGRFVPDDPKTPDRNEAYVEEVSENLSILESYKATLKKFRTLY
tara:strand:+ start:2339 stop:2503 length:165 start_codon:yes stop_codon:yes gene_type:complete